ncbi:MAG: 50S ribosomal protein L25 [Opitutales bacterium]|nr:50S ribosomal protein L25 [Opitutales bacterium]
MKELTLNVQKREAAGRGSSRRLRASGRIPAIVYGKSGNTSLSVSESDFKKLYLDIAGSAAFIQINDGDSSKKTIIKDAQLDAISRRFIHVDFNEVDENTVMTVEVPIRTKGVAYGVKTEGGVLNVSVKNVTIRCNPKDLPEAIEVDVTDLKKGEMLHRKQLPALEGVKYPGDPASVILAVTSAS